MGYFQEYLIERPLLGSIREKTRGNWYEYRKTDSEWAISQGLQYEIALNFGQIRYANIIKTRAYIAVDENAEGFAELETWVLSQHATRKGS